MPGRKKSARPARTDLPFLWALVEQRELGGGLVDRLAHARGVGEKLELITRAERSELSERAQKSLVELVHRAREFDATMRVLYDRLRRRWLFRKRRCVERDCGGKLTSDSRTGDLVCTRCGRRYSRRR